MDFPTTDLSVLTRFEQYLIDAGHTRQIIARHLDCTEAFLGFLQQQGLAPEAVTPEHVARYLRAQLQRYRRKYGRSPDSLVLWHYLQSPGVHKFLAFVQGRWPPASVATSERERYIEVVLTDYERMLRERRTLSDATIVGQMAEARRFLEWLPGPRPSKTLAKLTIGDVDRYIKTRSAGIARTTIKIRCINTRSLLRFLHDTARIPRDLATALIGPTLYRFEGLPSTIRQDQIDAILANARKDRSPRGVRNYAMLLLLSTYGLRASEICRLQLGDIDWRGEQLWIRHTKTGARSCLPLLSNVGRAILEYVRRARPPCKDREIFIRTNAPRCAFNRSALYSMLRKHMTQTGIRLNGKRGPHVFRHARAASLLRAGVPLKTIGDLLGHRSVSSTAMYLKLADHELRTVALAIPLPEVSP
jgi:integrase/recombinase XerD